MLLTKGLRLLPLVRGKPRSLRLAWAHLPPVRKENSLGCWVCVLQAPGMDWACALARFLTVQIWLFKVGGSKIRQPAVTVSVCPYQH